MPADGRLEGSIVIVVSEAESAALVSEALALEAAERAFLAMVGRELPLSLTVPTPVEGHAFSVKPSSSPDGAGVKLGSYWPSNDQHGLPRHSSVVLLLDQATGRARAVVETSTANAFRTAAADALAVQKLSRPDSHVLTVVGYGHQAYYEARAVCAVRPIRTVLVTGRDQEKASRLAERLNAEGKQAAMAAPVQNAVSAADILVTATTSRDALFEEAWVRPGVHVSAMGADASGKQELPTGLLSRAALFCDVPEQSRRLGEFQHAPDDVEPVGLGEVLTGAAPGRTDPAQITIFDSSGIGLQDLYLALAILQAQQAAES